MTDEERIRQHRRVMVLSGVIILLLIACMVAIAFLNKVETPLYPLVIAVFLGLFWLVSDVLSVKWLDAFADKTAEQQKAYYRFALLDFAGLAFLVYFLVNMDSLIGALGFVSCMFAKRKEKEVFDGPSEDPDAAKEATSGEADAGKNDI